MLNDFYHMLGILSRISAGPSPSTGTALALCGRSSAHGGRHRIARSAAGFR